ncbi:MAG: DNA polymerase I [Oscillospiraceae bacterium]|nr:DNA polymerase I [Oscillospiraceae bacterium]
MKCLVVDGNSILNRAFYGIRLLSTKDGVYTNAVHGFLTILQRVQREEQPDAVCVAFDRKEPTFRHEKYPDYKAGRHAMPEELVPQVPLIKEVLDGLKIPRYEQPGFEADDLIGTISVRCEEAGWECVILTGDKDNLQLITDKVSVALVSSRMGRTETKKMTPERFREEYGFLPPLMVDLKGLMGDPSDHIPGVSGVGEKTAMRLVQQYGTVEALYAALNTSEEKPGVLKKLTEGRDSAFFSKELATICKTVPMEFKPEDALVQPPDEAALYPLFLTLEFQKQIQFYGLHPVQKPARIEKQAFFVNQTVLRTTDELQSLLEQCKKELIVALSGEKDLSGICLFAPSFGCVWLAQDTTGYEAFLRELFSGKIPLAAHEVKDWMGHLLSRGLPIEGFVFDTALAAYLLSPTDGSYALERLSVAYLNRELQSEPAEEQLSLSLPGMADLTEELLPKLAAAHFERARCIGELHEILFQKLKELQLEELYKTIEIPLCRVLAQMEQTGFLLDQDALRQFGTMLETRISQLENSIYTYAGGTFNLNSPKQLGEILFGTLQLPPVKKTKTGYSTNAEVLEKLRHQHPIIDEILEYRQLSKLKSTYVDGLFAAVAPDGRLHTSFQMTVTATGRLSSTEPNLQNIPVRTELGKEMRKMFLAAPGYVLVDADYSQIELRLLAHIADDQAMQQAFLDGVDIHTVTASQVMHVPVEQVTPQMRSNAKAVNFGIVYGISEFSLAQDIGTTRAQAKEYMDAYFSHYQGVRQYMDQVVKEAKKKGYAETLMHRRRYLPELQSSNYNTRSFGERVALNMPIQGTAADLMKLAMVRVDGALRKKHPTARLVLQVHDELLVECKEEESEDVLRLLKEEMEGVWSLNVPLVVDGGIGKTWYEAKE